MPKNTILPFLADLKKNNDRDWFTANKSRYEKAKDELNGWISELLPAMIKMDPDLAGLEPKNCVFRIYRDVRFSKDKSPYKTNMGAYFAPGGRNSSTMKPGYYLHLEPGQSFIAGGLYMPTPEQLKGIRQEIDYNWDEFESLLNAPAFKKYFKKGLDTEMKLKTLPKGYTADNPAIEALKLKSFTVSGEMGDKDVNADNFLAEVLNAYKALQPMAEFIRRAIVE